MKINELPEAYKIYTLSMSNKSQYEITGAQKESIMNADTQWVALPNGTSVNKAFCVEVSLNIDRTRENVQEHLDEIKAMGAQLENPLAIITDDHQLL